MLDYLTNVPLFQNLNDTQLSNIEAICIQKSYAAGTVLFDEKEPGTIFYIIKAGSVKIYTNSQSGEEKILSVFKTGDSFGELSLIDGKPRSTSAQTMENSTLYMLSAADFIELLKNHFEITLSIMRELCQRIRDTNQHVHDLTFLDARTRIVKNLISLANTYGKPAGTSSPSR